ncbi:MAG: hypothetical protein HC883_05495 [Bdellovibrionaceae bacterium]|nr:hypothetical protein [Pseudobdellovibrionaceae bacterium]
MRSPSFLAGYLFWVVLVILVAHGSGYRADDIVSINWDVVFLITPFGLIDNLIFGANAYLHKVYWYKPPGLKLSADHAQFNWHYLYIYLQSNLLEVIPLAFLWPRWRPRWTAALQISVVNSFTHPIVFLC